MLVTVEAYGFEIELEVGEKVHDEFEVDVLQVTPMDAMVFESTTGYPYAFAPLWAELQGAELRSAAVTELLREFESRWLDSKLECGIDDTYGQWW